jgi:hypothetical protein
MTPMLYEFIKNKPTPAAIPILDATNTETSIKIRINAYHVVNKISLLGFFMAMTNDVITK